MDMSYALGPFLAWFVAGLLKFVINSLRTRCWAFDQIGYGSFPSNHSAIVSCMAALVAFREGIGHPAFGVALTLAFIVILDAASLRRQIGAQAAALNRLLKQDATTARSVLRERVGHTPLEISAGILVGCGVAAMLAR